MKRYFTLNIYGQKAVDAGYAVNKGRCYSQILDGIGQLEVTVDEPGEYKGCLNKWVNVSYIKRGEDIPVVLDELARLGFKGCWCYITEDIENGCFAEGKELCSLKI